MNVFDQTLAKKISDCGNIAVVVIEDADKAVKLAKTLLEGGVNVMELTLRTPAALEALKKVATAVPEMIAESIKAALNERP